MNKNNEQEITPLGSCNFRSQRKKFGIKLDDRRRHVYIIGKTGVGKTTLLENMAIADIRSGKGVAVVDPHGEFAEKLLDFIPEERLDDVIYFNPADMNYPVAFNPMEQVGTEFRHLVASGMMGVFKKIWPDVWSARMEYILNNALLALLELPGSTILGVIRMLSEPVYRKKIIENIQDPVIKAFWVNEFSKYTQRLETEAVAAIQNKIGQFISNPLIRNILGQGHSTLNMREIMDTGKIFIVNLSKGKIGEDNSALLGAMIITRLQLAAMSRVDMPEDRRRDFFLYVDEFQNFATESFANILSEARKYHLSLVLAHQYIGQLVHDNNTKVRDAVFGNVGTIVTFRIGAADAEFLEKEFMPEFLQNDLVNLAKANIYIKLMIDGVASRPFSAETVAPQKTPLLSYKDVIVKNSQEHYGTPKKLVEQKIAGEWQSASQDLIEDRVERKNEARLTQVLKTPPTVRRERPHPSAVPKKGVNIDDLKKAISQSLGMQSKTEPKEESAVPENLPSVYATDEEIDEARDTGALPKTLGDLDNEAEERKLDDGDITGKPEIDLEEADADEKPRDDRAPQRREPPIPPPLRERPRPPEIPKRGVHPSAPKRPLSLSALEGSDTADSAASDESHALSEGRHDREEIEDAEQDAREPETVSFESLRDKEMATGEEQEEFEADDGHIHGKPSIDLEESGEDVKE